MCTSMHVLFLFFSLFFLEELVLCVLHVLPNKPSNLKPSKIVKPKPFWKYLFWKNMNIHVLETQQTHQNSETKTKTEATNLRLNQSNPYEKIKTDQPIKPIWNQNQIKPIKRIYPSNPRPINLSNPPPINPSTTTEFLNQTHQTHCRSTYQTHRQSTHSPPPSSQIKKLKH